MPNPDDFRFRSNFGLKDRKFCHDCQIRFRLSVEICSFCHTKASSITILDKRGLRVCNACIRYVFEVHLSREDCFRLETARSAAVRTCDKHQRKYTDECPLCEKEERHEKRIQKQQKQAQAAAQRAAKKSKNK
jgi:hypothetical protein